MKKHIRDILFVLPIISLLCSFGLETVPTGYAKVEGKACNNVSDKISVGTQYTKDLGRRGALGIGQCMKWKINSYKTYNITNNGFLLQYENPLINPASVKSTTFAMTKEYSTQYSFAFKKSETTQIQGYLSESFNIKGFGKIEGGVSLTESTTIETDYSYSVALTTSETITMDLKLDSVPIGYMFSPALVTNAVELNYNYTIYDEWWWGDKPVQNQNEVDVNNGLLIYDPSSIMQTICIKKKGSSGRPQYYLK